MKWTTAIFSLAFAGVLTVLWLRSLNGGHSYSIQVPPSAAASDYIEGRNKTRLHLLFASDARGAVFDIFIRKLPPEKAPGPPGSEACQQWLGARARRTATAYVRFIGFEKGVQFRHGQVDNETIYFFGTDYYFAVPHVVLILLGAIPGMYILATCRTDPRRSSPPETPMPPPERAVKGVAHQPR